MQRHVKRMGTAKTEMRWLGRGCPRLAVGDKTSTKGPWKKPAPDAVAVGEGFWAVPLAGPSQLWTVTEQGTGSHLYRLVSLMVHWKVSKRGIKRE